MITSNNFGKKLQRNPEEILEVFAEFLKICSGGLQKLIGHFHSGGGAEVINHN